MNYTNLIIILNLISLFYRNLYIQKNTYKMTKQNLEEYVVPYYVGLNDRRNNWMNYRKLFLFI